jgi:hypothetical protein
MQASAVRGERAIGAAPGDGVDVARAYVQVMELPLRVLAELVADPFKEPAPQQAFSQKLEHRFLPCSMSAVVTHFHMRTPLAM